jgi:hypothetical protein
LVASLAWSGRGSAALRILSRAEWEAKPAGPGLAPQSLRAIMIHHTGEKANPRKQLAAKMKDLQHFSMTAAPLATGKVKPAWPDVPYHFYVDVLGGIAEGRDVYMKGDTNTNYNPDGFIQIAVEGSFDKEAPTAAQIASVRALVRQLEAGFKLAPGSVRFHNQLAQTICPGRHLIEAIGDLSNAAGKSG